MFIFLTEITYYDANTFQPVTLRFSSGDQGYTTLPTDTPANTWYEPRIKVPNDYQCSVFKNGLTGGSAGGGAGEMQLANDDGFFDQFLNQAFDGHQVRLLYGDPGSAVSPNPYSSFVVLFTGTMCQPDVLWDICNIKLCDFTEFFDKPLSQYVYLGNNVAGVGMEGTPDDLMGKSKAVCVGTCYNITPSWVSQSGLLYHFHNGPAKAVDTVYTNGTIMPQDLSVNGTVEAASATYTSALSFTLTGVNKTSTYVAGLMLLIVQASGNAGNLVVVSSTYTGGNTVVTLAVGAYQIANTFTLASGSAITKVAYGGGDCATLAAVQAATPASNMFCTCLALGLFKISGGASSDITADVRGDNAGGVFASTAADICQRIIQNYALRARTNLIQQSENRTNAAWVASGGALNAGTPPSVPIVGMGAAQFIESAGAGPHTVTQTCTQASGMYCYSDLILPTANRYMFRMKLVNHANSANNCYADFDTLNNTVLLLSANGAAVGPQYTATGFITNGGIIYYPNGWVRLWVAGQPDQTFTQIDTVLELLTGTDVSYTDAYTGDGVSGVWLAGAQLEAYSSPAIYTGPTTTTPVTGYDPNITLSLNAASFAALNAAAPYAVGYYVPAGDTTTMGSVMDALLQSVGGYRSQDRLGNIYVGQFTKPSSAAVPVATFTQTQFLGAGLVRSAPFDSKDGTPAFRIAMSAVRNWTAQAKSNLASIWWTNNPTRVSWLAQQWRQVRAENITVLWQHPLACELAFTSYVVKQADALTEATRLLALYSARLDRFTFTTKLSLATSIVIGSIVNLTSPRFGLSSGKNFVVVGITEAHETGHVTLEVLG